VKLAKCSGTPHIVKMATPFKEGTVACLPMEYVDGNSLRDRSEPILSEPTALKYIRQIGSALAVVHGQQLVHGDVRPANIFLRIREGKAEAVLTDFGLALDCDAVLTRTRDKERADGFSPIELYARGQAVGAYTDVYSLAATLYELLTGEVPVSAYDRKARGYELVSPQVKNLEISGKTAKAILAGMELEEIKRPQSVQAWLEKLGVGNLEQETPPAKANWQTIWGALGVVVALLIGIPAWLALKPDSPPAPPSSSTLQNTPK
jgi:eukaryotic-like serine/threonine-protein kinase